MPPMPPSAPLRVIVIEVTLSGIVNVSVAVTSVYVLVIVVPEVDVTTALAV